MNRHPLTQDFSMYYAGSFIFALIEGVPHAMLVETTERGEDDTQLSGVYMVGNAYTATAELGTQRWTADMMVNVRPFSGYYDVGRRSKDKAFIQWAVNNRSQRKGFDQRQMIVDGEANGLNGRKIASLYAQSLEMCSRPLHRDFWIKGDLVNWKGTEVGKMVEGTFKAHDQYKPCEELVCRLLQNI